MSAKRTCPQCSAELRDDELEGLCPDCLGKLALGAESEGQRLKAKGQSSSDTAAVGEVGRDVPIAPVAAIQHPVSSIEHPAARFGDYELLSEIAHGGMGVVFKARQVSLNRTVAVKMIRAGPFASKEFVHRFRVEASAAAVLQHPNIVAVHEVGVHEGQHFFSMDYVAGQNLAQIARDGPLPATRAARYVQKIAEAIHYAHQSGILHRDLKPSNVLIDQNDQPRITDFGLAKQLNSESSATLTGEVLGTPGYMPPEQASGNRGAVKAWSDVYSLGAILYHLLTGRAPFAAGSLEETLNQVLHQDPVSIRLLNPAVARDLATICLKCLEKEPAKRYGSAQLLSEELTRFLNHEPIQARPISAVGKAARWCRRKPALATALGLIVLVAVGSPIVTLRIYRESQKTQRALAQARIEEGKAWLERAESYVEEKNPFYAKLMAGRAIGFRGAGREKLTESQREHFLELLPPDSAEAREAKLIVWGSDDYAPVWHRPVTKDFNHALSRSDVAAAFSPDGRLLALASHSTNIALWNVGRGTTAALRGHSNNVIWIAFSPDGQLLASASHDHTMRLWDVETQKSLITLPGYSGDNQVIAFSPDGNLLAACGESEHDIKIWELSSGRLLSTLDKDIAVGYWSLAFSPDGTLLAAACADGTIELRDVPTFGLRFSWKAHSRLAWDLAFSPNGSVLASGSHDNTLRLWKMPTGSFIKELHGHLGGVATVRFSPGGDTLASRDNRGVVRLWSMPEGGFKAMLPASTLYSFEAMMSFSPDGTLLAMGGPISQVWDLTTRHLEAELTGHSKKVRKIALDQDGLLLASASSDQTVALWDLASPQTERTLLPHPNVVVAVALSPDNRWVVSACKDGIIRFWERATGRLDRELRGHGTDLVAISFNPEGTLLGSVGRFEKTLRLWDMTNPRGQFSIVTGRVMLQELAFDPKGRWVATVGGDIQNAEDWVKLWEVATRRPKAPPLLPRAWCNTVKFSRDGQWLAAGEDQGVVNLWEAESGRLTARFLSHRHGINGVDFSPDGRLLASASTDHTIALWDARNTNLLARLRGHSAAVSSVVFSPDGQRLISGSEDTTIRIWNVASALDRSLDYARFVDWFDLEGRNVTWKILEDESSPPDTARTSGEDADPKTMVGPGVSAEPIAFAASKSPAQRDASTYPPSPMPMKSFTGKSLVAVLQSGLPEEELDRALFRRFLRAGNLSSARLLVERHGQSRMAGWQSEAQTLGRAYLREAKAVLDYESYRLAAQHAFRARTFVPEKAAQAWHVTALAERGLKRWPESLAAIEKAITLEANNPDFWHDKALILEEQGQKSAAREALLRAIDLARQVDEKNLRLENWRQHLEQLGR